LVQNVEAAPAALALERVARIRQGLQFAQNKARDDERAAQKSCRAKIGNAAIDDDVCIYDDRLALRRLARETDIRNDEREFIAVAPHRQHHPEITEGAIDDEPRRPLGRLALVAQNV